MALVPFPDPSASEPEPDDARLDDVGEPDTSGGRMSFLEHLDELRKRLVISALSLVAGFLICFAFISYIFDFIMRGMREPLPPGAELVYTEPTEAFFLYIKMAALAGLVLAIPVVLYQLWLFVAPGMYAHEKRFAIPFVFFATLFFVAGALFSHFMLFPWAWRFFASFSTNSEILEFLPRIQPAFSLYVKLLLACGLVFQMPTMVFFLARVGAVTPGFLARNIKYAILLIFVFAAVLTPTGDPVTLTMMAAPMIALYVFSIAIAWVFRKRRNDE